MMYRFLPLLLSLCLFGCQPLPHPLAANAPAPDAPIMTLKDGAGIFVEPVTGLSPELGSATAEAMAAALRDADIPAATLTRNRGSFVLNSTAPERPSAALPRRLHWRLLAPDGRTAGEGERLSDAKGGEAGQSGEAQIMAKLAQMEAPRIAAVFEEDGVTAVEDDRKVAVSPVAGAPGDGTRSLADAMRNALRHAHVDLAEDQPASQNQTARAETGDSPHHYTVAGSVKLEKANPGMQKVTVRWALLGTGGGQIGEVTQENTIPAGSLDGPWGDIAFVVANSAAGGIVALLEHMKTAAAGTP